MDFGKGALAQNMNQADLGKAAKHPQAEVTGIDLSPTQPKMQVSFNF